VALHPADEPGPYPVEVRRRIRQDCQADHASAANALNDRGVSVVSLQHDFGIWGGADGAYVLDFTRALRLPLVVTLHSVPASPTPSQHAILRELMATADTSVVMSQVAAALVGRLYGPDPARVEIIPHGIADLPLIDPGTVKPRLGMQSRTVILSLGLVGPEKGYESVIEAMPAIIEAVPSACYVILGATKPETLRRDGEAYRDGLKARADDLGLADHVRFVDKFVGRVDLATWLEAADVVVTPYRDLDRTVSGSLAYAMGAGKPVVSTPFAYASEMLANGRGFLVPAGSVDALGAALVELGLDAALRATTGKRAYDHTRRMVWREVGVQYRALFDRAIRSSAARPRLADDRKFAAIVA
jgi:glycosyltransferase involved in cell wall biosynthesis